MDYNNLPSVEIKPYKITEATESDVEDYIVCALEFHKKMPLVDMVPFDENGFEFFFREALKSDLMKMWIARVEDKPIAVCGAAISSLYFNPHFSGVQEMWWWVLEEYRGCGVANDMYKNIEEWARSMGASLLFMVALSDDSVDRVEKLYKRKGYVPTERTYVKELI